MAPERCRSGKVTRKSSEPDEIIANINNSFDEYTREERTTLLDYFKMLIQRGHPVDDIDSGVGSEGESEVMTSTTHRLTFTDASLVRPLFLSV